MIKAMDRLDRPSLRLVTMMGLSLGFLNLGCAGMNGFRSVGTERPSLLGFRTSSQAPSPTPLNDLYAQNMHANDSKTSPKANQTELTSGHRGDDAVATRPTTELAKATDLDVSPMEPAPSIKPVGGTTMRVTLGRPEPLPIPPRPGTTTGGLASKPSSSGWKADSQDRNPENVSIPRPLQVAGNATKETPLGPQTHNPPRKAEGLDPKAILDQAEARLNDLNTYQVKISRIERVGGQLQPEEDILLSIQRDPKAVRLEWADGPNKGREVIYCSALDPQMIFVHVASSPIPIPTMKIAVNSPMVIRNSRHAITEAGFDTIIENLQKSRVQATTDQKAGDALNYKGVEAPPGVDAPSHHFVRKTPSGETWNVYLDSRTMLPRLVSAEDSRGELVERYIYREVRENPAELKTASAFVPDQRWGESKSLFSRLARAAAGPAESTASQSTTR